MTRCEKKRLAIVLLAAFLFGGFNVPARAAELFVAPGGRDDQPGTREQPLATLAAARDAARKAEAGPHRIAVMPGEYFLAETLEVDGRDSGLTIEAEPGGPAVIYGGRLVTGWQRDGDKFWSADLEGVKEGQWDFRALVINGRMPQRARFPATGTFLNRGTWSLPLLPAVAGYWERKPTEEELTTMPYDPQDIPPTLDVRNAEVRLYHMWDESLVGVAKNDVERECLIFSSAPIWPPGALGIKKYVIWNTREGMTQPGQWYLDRSGGRVVYWPLPDEDMAAIKVVAPTMERVIRIAGDSRQKAERITIRGLVLQCATPPLKPASFGAGGLEGALSIANAKECVIEAVEIANVGGLGIAARELGDCRIADCEVHHTGACGVKVNATGTRFSDNHVHHVGVYYPSAAATMLSGTGLVIDRNEIHDAPYSGLIGGGKDHLIEQNLIYRVMLEMHDGAAINGNLANCVLRGNMVRDIAPVGEGFGVSAYYLDEGAHDCTIERNVSVGVARPTHNHIARNITIRDNVFIVDRDMVLSFQSPSACTFERNTLFAPGRISVGQPNGVKRWERNIVFRGGVGQDGSPQAFTIDDAMPPVATPARKSGTAEAARVAAPPPLEGEFTPDQWPGKIYRLDRDISRLPACGPPVLLKLCYDEQFLYVAVTATMFEPAEISTGEAWGKDDGAEIAIAGNTPDGKPAVFVIRGYAEGKVESAADGGAPAEAVARLGQAVRFSAETIKGRSGSAKGWRGRWAIPFDAIGLKPEAGAKIAFNVGAFCSQYGEWHCWEGTLAENWRLDEGGTLLLLP